jgi:hypothetical protein
MMTKQEKIALSEQVGRRYGIAPAIKPFRTHYLFDTVPVYLADDSARCFELAVDNSLILSTIGNDCTVNEMNRTQRYVKNFTIERYADHPSKAEATRIAILKALVKLKGE